MDSILPSTSSALQPGTRVADYTIEALLGQGAQGCVYLARDSLLGRLVALKTLRGGLPGATRGVEEARLLSTLEHPNLVRVYHAVRHQGIWYVVSEYLGGGTLHDLLQREGRMSVSQTLDLVGQAARGLAYAHLTGVIHRDVKPDNMLLSHLGEVKLADFGLAQVAQAENRTVSATVGTPGFRAPELQAGSAATPAADVYSLGVTLYVLLTGNSPSELTPHSGAQAGLRLPSEIPRPVRELLARMLETAPHRRPPSSSLPELLSRLALEPTRNLVLGQGEPSLPEPLAEVGSAAVTRHVMQHGPDQDAFGKLTDLVSNSLEPIVVTGASVERLHQLVEASWETLPIKPHLVLREVLKTAQSSLRKQCARAQGRDLDSFGNLFSSRAIPRTHQAKPYCAVIHLLNTPSPQQWTEIVDFIEAAAESGVVSLILVSELPGAACVAAFPKLQVVQIDDRDSAQMEARLKMWLEAASDGKMRFTTDAVRLAMSLCLRERHSWSQLVFHSLLIALSARLPLVTSWAVLGASRIGTALNLVGEVPAAWRTPPSAWPTTAHSQLLTELRDQQLESSRSPAAVTTSNIQIQ